MWYLRKIFMIILILFLFNVVISLSKKCHINLTIDITNGTKTTINGIEYILHDNVKYSKDDYYYNTSSKNTQIFGCLCNVHRCIRKCCPIGQSFFTNGCNYSNDPLSVNFKVPVHNTTKQIAVSDNHFKFVIGKQCEYDAYELKPKLYPEDLHYLQHNGTLYFPNSEDENSAFKKPEEFCFDISEGENETEIIALSCFPEPAESMQPTLVGMLISMPFLLITFFVYACVPELQNIHGKCLMCYVSTLFTAYVFLVTVQLNTKSNETFCVVAPFIIYFAFMVSFMWLNVMCVDIWWTFSGRRGFKGSVRQSERKRFLVYSIYAWGIPLIMLSITIGLQFAPELPESIIRPQFGVQKCWFPDDKAVGYYFYYPILVIIIVNLGLFAYTTLKIWNVQRNTDLSMSNESQRHGNETDKQRYKLYLKLMLVFGINWLMEIVSWWLSSLVFLWYVTDMCNALYGVFIFIIFVCKANVWKLVRKRYHVMMGRPYMAKTFGPTSSTRSTDLNNSTTQVTGNTVGTDSYALTSTTHWK